MPDVDFTSDDLALVLLVRAEYVDASGDVVVVRWCGPPEATGSGLYVRDAEADGLPHTYEARIDKADDDADLGGLDDHVQTIGALSFTVRYSPEEDDELRTAALTYRWAGREASAWVYDRTSGLSRMVFRGVVERNPTRIREGDFSLDLTDEIAGRGALWPMSRVDFPANDPTKHQDDVVLNAATGQPHPIFGTPNLDHTYHPSLNGSGIIYGVPELRRGRWCGPVFSTSAGVWCEVVFYGFGSLTDGGGVQESAFFHLGPQFDLFAKFMYFQNDKTGQLETASHGIYLQSFNNHDASFGPVGSNCRLVQPGAFTPTANFWDRSEARVVCRIENRGGGVDPAKVDEGGIIEGLSTTYASWAPTIDADVIDEVFTSTELLDAPDLLHADALSRFRATGPTGPVSGLDWRRFNCRVPLELESKPLTLREGLGTLAAAVQADFVMMYDAGNRDLRYAPVRRRPNPADPTVDHRVAEWMFPGGSGVGSLGWEITDEPRKRYGTTVSVEGALAWDEPLRPASYDLAESEIAPESVPIATSEDPAELAAVGYPIEAKAEFEHWRQATDDGFEEAARYEASSRMQRQTWSTVTLGTLAMGWELGDTVAYTFAPLSALGTGHIRSRRRDFIRQQVTLRVCHVEFCAGALPGGGT